MLLFRRRGMKSLLRQRLARIFLPLLVGCATIIPAFDIISKAAIQINPQEPLVASILSGQMESVRDQLKSREIAQSEDHIFHYTMLEWAAMHGSPETISLLVEAGSDVNRQNSRGDTPLHLSVYYGRDLAVAKLIELGADPTITNHSGDLPIDIRHTSADAAAEISTLFGLPEMNPEEVVHGRENIAKILDVHSAQKILSHFRRSSEIIGLLWLLNGSVLVTAIGLCTCFNQTCSITSGFSGSYAGS